MNFYHKKLCKIKVSLEKMLLENKHEYINFEKT